MQLCKFSALLNTYNKTQKPNDLHLEVVQLFAKLLFFGDVHEIVELYFFSVFFVNFAIQWKSMVNGEFQKLLSFFTDFHLRFLDHKSQWQGKAEAKANAN